MIRLGLRAKFIVVILTTLTLLFSVIAILLVRLTRHNLQTDLNNRAKVFASLATKPIGDAFVTYQDSGTQRINQQVTRFTDLDSSVTNVAVVDTIGRQLFSQDESNVRVSADQAASFDNIYVHDNEGYIREAIAPYVADTGIHRYNLVYEFSSADAKVQIAQTERSILIAAIIGLGASAIVVFVLINWLFLNPLGRVRRQALVISAGNLAQQISIDTHDEVGDLAAVVNKMSEALKANIAKLVELDHLKSEFMMITSHNLRTPLTIINGYLDELSRAKLPKQTTQELELIAVNVQRLRAFTEDILAISQVESGQDLMMKEPTELGSFLEDVAGECKILAAQKHITFTSSIASGHYTVLMNAVYLRSALWNLLDNALKFTKAGGKISLEMTIIGGKAQIAVKDTGVGIAPAEVPKLFTKFHRGTSTLEYEYEGTGIGLYATKLVIERHGGTIIARSDYGKGSIFTVTLPLAS